MSYNFSIFVANVLKVVEKRFNMTLMELVMMSSSTNLGEANGTNYFEPLSWLFVKDNFQDKTSTPWLRAQSEISFHFHNPFPW